MSAEVKRVGLVMIVKNEEDNIKRALDSVRPFINTWVIVDTGSTDRTMEIIREVYADIPGHLFERPWVNFGANRSELMALATEHMDWAIMMDADDTLEGVVPPKQLWDRTDIDGFMLTMKHGGILHRRAQIFRTAATWRYEGVLHEYAVCVKGMDKTVLAILPEETYMITRCEGIRSKDPLKYENDAALLAAEYARDPSNKRTLFYLAQSYRDAKQVENALTHYRTFLDINDAWVQERYIAIANIVNLIDDMDEQMRLAWRALELCPDRLDVSFFLLNQWRQQKRPLTAELWALATAVENRKINPNWLYINHDINHWAFDDILSVMAYEKKDYVRSVCAAARVAVGAPPHGRENAIHNLKLASDALNGL
jgi:glycosyltransferase involved in cell wall biosynthesis